MFLCCLGFIPKPPWTRTLWDKINDRRWARSGFQMYLARPGVYGADRNGLSGAYFIPAETGTDFFRHGPARFLRHRFSSGTDWHGLARYIPGINTRDWHRYNSLQKAHANRSAHLVHTYCSIPTILCELHTQFSLCLGNANLRSFNQVIHLFQPDNHVLN